jgi:16S rRNA (adenine1518-N6/adenine1519-N6)-dimethyltransferase
MQSKGQIKRLLESAGITIKKRFGQNFLIDANLMRILVDSADITKNDIVLEVGCGTGSLTEELAEKAGCVIAVEIDKTTAQIARQQLPDNKNVKIINHRRNKKICRQVQRKAFARCQSSIQHSLPVDD